MSAGKTFLWAAFGAALLFGSMPAFANDLPSSGLSRLDIMHWLQREGVSASIQHDDVAQDDYIAASFNGVNYGIYMYACDGDYCKSIQYSAGWTNASDVTTDHLNEWNRTKRYLRSYRDDQGNVFAEYDIDIGPGGTWEQMDATLSRWQSILPDFSTFIGR